MIKNFKCILFDIDGVLIDSVGHYTKLIRGVAETLGADPTLDELFYRRNLGVAFDQWMRQIVPSQNHYKIASLFDERNQELQDGKRLDLFQGAFETLLEISASWKKIGLVSTKTRKGIDALLESKKLNPLVQYSVSGDEVAHYKPNPEGIKKALDFLGMEKKDVVFIGDSFHDYGAAVNADVAFIGVTSGVCSEDDWKGRDVVCVPSLRNLWPQETDEL